MSQERTFGKGCRVLILGATSGIAKPLALEFARRGFDLVLAGRDQEEMQTIAADARVRCGVKTELLEFSALDYDSHDAFWQSCGEIDGVVVAFGVMTSQPEAERDWEKCRVMLESNYNATVSILNRIALDFETRQRGFIAVISSVAGDRARRSNYIYASAKSGVSAYAEGLRARLYPHGVSVTTIKPGPVDTGMTWGADKLPLLAPPEKVASDIYRGIRRKAEVVYTPAPWRVLMTILRLVPAWIWKRMNF
jgi:short-subunit dehydrogenase